VRLTAWLGQQLYPSATLTRIEPEDAALVGELAVLGYDWSGPHVKAGQPLYLTLYWKALVDQQSQDNAFVHLGQGTSSSPLVAAHDGPPCQGLYPTPNCNRIIIGSAVITAP